MRIGKKEKIRAKCPACGRASTTRYEPSSSSMQWLIYECVDCNIKFRMQKGWRSRLRREGG